MYWGLKIDADSELLGCGSICHEILNSIQDGPGYTAHNNKLQQFFQTNKIKVVENIYHLDKLVFLDLSNNLIEEIR